VNLWIFALIAAFALGMVLFGSAESSGNKVFASVTGSVDPYLQQGMSEESHEEIRVQTEEVATWLQEKAEELGLEVQLDGDLR
jgi:hypothetical protein